MCNYHTYFGMNYMLLINVLNVQTNPTIWVLFFSLSTSVQSNTMSIMKTIITIKNNAMVKIIMN